MKLTKEIVDKMLDANVKNRKVNLNHVQNIARSMREGFFIPNNGQTIVINRSFSWLLDGQHRLLAIRAAGYPIYDIDVKIIEDEDASRAFETIDCVRTSRTTAQIMTLEGMKNAKRICSMVRYVAFYAWGYSVISVNEIKKCVSAINDEIERVHITTKCIGVDVQDSIHGGILNAMLLRPHEKERIEQDWLCVLNNHIPNDKPGLASLQTMIVSKCEPKNSYRFYKATKAMLCPTLKKIPIGNNEDLSALKSRVVTL